MARQNRYLSFLAVEVEPGTNQKLSAFEQKIEAAFDRVSAFNDRGAGQLGVSSFARLDPRAKQSADQTSQSLQRVATQGERARVGMAAAAQGSNALATGLTRTAQSLTIVQGSLGPLAGRVAALGTIFRDLAGISLAGVLGGAGAFAIGQIASSYAQAYDRLRPFYNSQLETNRAMSQVISIARETRQALDPIAQLYGRIGSAAKDAGLKVNQAALTETVAKAARLSGGDADTQQAGITQFLQGFGSGTLGGDELKSIRENTFRLAKALADGLGVPIAKLKQLGADGKLTPQVIAEALKRSADQIDIEFSRLALRPGQAITQASTNLSVFLGQLDQATGATIGFAKGIQAIGNNLDVTLSALAGFGAVFVVRNLTAPLNAASVALAGFTRQQQLIGRARAGAPVTLLTPTGIGKAKADTAVDTAAVNQRAADATVRAERAALFSIEQRLAAAREILASSTAQQRIEQQGAQQGVVLAQARVSAAQQELALAQQTSAARRAGDIEAARARLNAAREELRSAQSAQNGAQQRLTGANLAVESAAAGPGSRADRARASAVALRQQAVAEAELANAQQVTAAAAARAAAAEEALGVARAAQRTPTAALAAATAELTAAELALANATGAATTAAVTNAAAVNAQAARGIATLALAEQRIAAEARVAAATAASTAATEVQTLAMAAQATAQKAFVAATALSTRALGTLRAAAAGISALLGGPVGIALTAATVGITYLATRTDEAADAAKRFQDSQAALAEKLGTTTAQLMNQSEAARQLRVNLAAAGLEQARQTRQATRDALSGSLTTAAARLRIRGRFAEAEELSSAATNLAQGRDSGLRYERLQQIRNQNKGVFKFDGIGSTLARTGANLLGANPENIDRNVLGLAQTGREVIDQQKALADAQKALTAPQAKLPPIDLSGKGKGTLTTEQLKAYAIDAADNGTAVAEARAKYAKSIADLDAKLAETRKGDNPTAFDKEYIAGVRAAKNELTGVERAQRSAAAGAREHKKAIAEQNKELETARTNAQKLQSITSRYETPESAVRGGDRDKEALDNLFVRIKDGRAQILDTIQLLNNDTGKLEPFTRADAERVKRNIDEGVRRPIADAVREQGRELEISRLILEGRSDEAELLRQKYDLINRVGNLLPEEEQSLRNNAALQRQVNDAIAQRNRLIEIQVQGYRDMQEAATSLVRAAPDIVGGLVQGAAALTGAIAGGKSLGTVFKRGANAAAPGLAAVQGIAEQLMGGFRDAAAKQLTTKLFGDAEQSARDKMTRALETGSGYLQTAGDRLSTAAGQLTTAATALSGGGMVASDTPALAAGRAAIEASPFVLDPNQINRAIGTALGTIDDTLEDATKDIVVVASRAAVQQQRQAKPTEDPAGTSIEQRFNQIGKDFSTRIFGANSPLTRASQKLGTFLSGAQYAGVGVGVSQLFGSQGSQLGATIGGGLGKTLLGNSGGLFEKGLTAISSKLGSFAGPLGSIAGSVIGSVVGGLFKKSAPRGSAVITGVDTTARVGGDSRVTQALSGNAKSVQDSISRIAEAFGTDVGAFNVSIGKGTNNYRVSSTGSTQVGAKNPKGGNFIYDGPDEATAIQYAIRDAISDGAIKGIREGAKRLLQQGNNLDSALQKALDFNNVFRELKQMEDPVGAAVDDLNTQFNRLIDIFNQAGASTQEFADLQRLYDLKRAEAVKEAGNASLDALNDFLTGRRSGSESPLSRREVYSNAEKDLAGFRTDLAAGKTVDTDKLIEALNNKQDASAALNGSREAFYSDFADIIALAEKAKVNIEGKASTPSNLAPSPFGDAKTTQAIANTAGSTAQMAQDISSLLKEVRTANGGGGGAVNGSSLGYLPSMQGRVAQY